MITKLLLRCVTLSEWSRHVSISNYHFIRWLRVIQISILCPAGCFTSYPRSKKRPPDRSKRSSEVSYLQQCVAKAQELTPVVCYSIRLRLVEFGDRPDILKQMAQRALADPEEKGGGGGGGASNED